MWSLIADLRGDECEHAIDRALERFADQRADMGEDGDVEVIRGGAETARVALRWVESRHAVLVPFPDYDLDHVVLVLDISGLDDEMRGVMDGLEHRAAVVNVSVICAVSETEVSAAA